MFIYSFIYLGLDNWEIRAGTTYETVETREMTLKCTDVDNKRFAIKMTGDKTLNEICEACHAQWGLQPWIRVTIKRQDKQPFFMKHNDEYIVLTEYDPDKDPRPEVTLRIDLSDRTYLIEKVRIDSDPAKVMQMLANNYGFAKTNPTQVRFAPATPWTSGQIVTITFKTSTACAAVTLQQHTRRTFKLYVAERSDLDTSPIHASDPGCIAVPNLRRTG